MELRQLEYFTITCEKGSFNQAAECLYTTQPKDFLKLVSSTSQKNSFISSSIFCNIKN